MDLLNNYRHSDCRSYRNRFESAQKDMLNERNRTEDAFLGRIVSKGAVGAGCIIIKILVRQLVLVAERYVTSETFQGHCLKHEVP